MHICMDEVMVVMMVLERSFEHYMMYFKAMVGLAIEKLKELT